jgi:hypothetical protein
MNALGTITMTMCELDRFKVIQSVVDGPAEAVACRRAAVADDAPGSTPRGTPARTRTGRSRVGSVREAQQ